MVHKDSFSRNALTICSHGFVHLCYESCICLGYNIRLGYNIYPGYNIRLGYNICLDTISDNGKMNFFLEEHWQGLAALVSETIEIGYIISCYTRSDLYWYCFIVYFMLHRELPVFILHYFMLYRELPVFYCVFQVPWFLAAQVCRNLINVKVWMVSEQVCFFLLYPNVCMFRRKTTHFFFRQDWR